MRPLRACLTGAVAAALAASFLAAGAARASDSSPPQLTHTPVTKSAPGPLKISARITDESKIFPQIFMRAGNASAYEPPVDLKKVKGSKDTFEVTITARAGLEYYLECYDEYGNGPARSGTPDQPFKVELVEDAAAATAATAAAAASAAPPARAAPWLKGSGSAAEPAPERKVATAAPAPAPAPAPEKPAAHVATPAAPAAPATSAASDMVAAVEAASPRESARPSPAPEKPQAREAVHEAAAEKHSRGDSLRERPLSTTLEGAGPIGAEGALWRSLLLPGFGQFKTDRPVRGAIFGGAAAAGVITTVVLAVRANQANNILASAPVSVRGDAQDQAERYARARNLALGLTALVWLGQAAEAYFGFGSHD